MRSTPVLCTLICNIKITFIDLIKGDRYRSTENCIVPVNTYVIIAINGPSQDRITFSIHRV